MWLHLSVQLDPQVRLASSWGPATIKAQGIVVGEGDEQHPKLQRTRQSVNDHQAHIVERHHNFGMIECGGGNQKVEPLADFLYDYAKSDPTRPYWDQIGR